MLKKVLLFGLLTIMISFIMVFAYEGKFPIVAYNPPYNATNLTYNQYFPQAVDTLHFNALIQLGGFPFKNPVDFSAAQNDSLNLVNSVDWFSSGQYSMYQADRK
ncbi:MAG TPA: hypothetical protein VMT04_00320 [Terriglobales bacterium]|nr:hypothetical protein [Terriglobales bacterium]